MQTIGGKLRASVLVALVLAMALAALAATVPGARADHDAVNWSQSFFVGTTANDEQFSSVLADGRGTFYVFYLKTDSGTGLTDVFSSKWTTRGETGVPERLQADARVNDIVGDVVTVSPFFSLPQVPRGAIDHTGNLYVVWTSTSYDVFVSKSTDQGATWLPAVKANSAATTPYDFDPYIAITGTGATERIWVAWSQFWPTVFAFFSNVTVSYSANEGSTFIGYTNASGQGGVASTFLISPDLAADSLGRLYLTYTAIDISVFHVYANFTWSDNGATWAPPSTFSTEAGGFFPVLSVDARGRVHAGWIDETRTPTGAPTIYYVRSDTRGASWTTKVPVSQGQSGPSGSVPPAILAFGDTVMFTWDAQTFSRGLGYAISADGGDLWYPEQFFYPGFAIANTALGVDENGTFYATWTMNNGVDYDTGFSFWDGPPSRPVITSVARGTSSLTVSWSAVPEQDIAMYRVWRSSEGSPYELVAVVSPTTRTYLDSGLANGTYSYEVTAVDLRGTSSHPSAPMSATVGPTLQDLINQLQQSLNSANADLAALQAQLTNLQTQLNNLKSADQANFTQLQNQLSNLQTQLNNLQTQQATQTISYANLAFEVIVVVLLVVLLLNQMRRPKNPQMMMAQPAQVEPKKPEDEL